MKLGRKLERVPLNKRLYEQLKQDIIECRIEFGEKLTNRELQKRFGVSSTPVRDAINRLYLDGLVEDISNSGARVITFDLKFILEVNEMLSLLCCAAVESAAHTERDALCAQLEKVMSQQERASATDEYYHYDFLFHKAFFDSCQNTQYQKTYDRYHVLWEMLVRRPHGFDGNWKKVAVEQHRQILHDFRTGQTKLAVEQTRAHFMHADQLFRQYMKTSPGIGPASDVQMPYRAK